MPWRADGVPQSQELSLGNNGSRRWIHRLLLEGDKETTNIAKWRIWCKDVLELYGKYICRVTADL